jgi:hypothetical protein
VLIVGGNEGDSTSVLDLIGGGPQPMGTFFIIHTFAMESFSFSSPLIHEKENK